MIITANKQLIFLIALTHVISYFNHMFAL